MKTRSGLYAFSIVILVLASLALACGGTPKSVSTPGKLGISRSEWEKIHGKANTDEMPGMYSYNGGQYLVQFVDDNVRTIEHVWQNGGVSLKDAQEQSEKLIPTDASFVRSYSPSGLPELKVELYQSEYLMRKFDDDAFIGGEPGDFIVVYFVYDGVVPSIIVAIGNNP